MDEQQFNEYLRNAFIYQGQVNAMANSIELMLSVILEGQGIKIKPRDMLGKKIRRFEESKAILADKYAGDFGELVKKLQKFNEDWIITKHGMTSGGQKDLTIYKDGKFYIFDLKKQEEISREFTEIMGVLTEISKGM